MLDGLARYRLEQAVADYEAGEINLGEGAGRAGVTVPRLLAELDRRGVDTIGPAHFRASLANLVSLFGGSAELRAIATDQPTGPSVRGAMNNGGLLISVWMNGTVVAG